MVNNQKVLEKLKLIKENLAKLSLLKDIPVDLFCSDFEKYDSAKYNLQTAIEAMLDICNHIIARKTFPVPKTNAEAFRLLCRKKQGGTVMVHSNPGSGAVFTLTFYH